jgi:hypothetical protein
MEEHLQHLRAVCDALRAARLFGNLEKCNFCTTRGRFLATLLLRRALRWTAARLRPSNPGPRRR